MTPRESINKFGASNMSIGIHNISKIDRYEDSMNFAGDMSIQRHINQFGNESQRTRFSIGPNGEFIRLSDNRLSAGNEQ